MNEGLLNRIVGFMDSFSMEYSGFMKNNPCKIPVIKNQAPSKMKNAVGYYSYYSNNSNIVELALNGQYHSDLKFFQQQIEKALGNSQWVANASPTSTFIHEFGHHVSNSMKWISKDVSWEYNFIKDCIAEYNAATGSTIKGYWECKDIVSKYGTKSTSELFAETFSEYFGGEDPREFAMIFGKKLDELLKGVK